MRGSQTLGLVSLFYIWPAYRAGISSANTALLADVLHRLPSGRGCPSKAPAAGKGVGQAVYLMTSLL